VLVSAPTAALGRRYPRILGSYQQGRPGPLLVVTAGIHGNEPMGAEAVLRVLACLERRETALRGRLLAVAGNLEALARNERYLDEDLNRLWTRDGVARLRAQEPALDSREQRQQRELIEVLEPLLRGPGEVAVVDLHTSSGRSVPFACMGDTLANRRLAFALPVPVVLGLEETIDGTWLDWVYEHRQIAVAVEGGRHQDPDTADNLEAVVWIALVALGCLAAEDVPDLDAHRRRLAAAVMGTPRVLEVRHREELASHDQFRMRDGYASFQEVRRGELLAWRNGAEVRAGEDGRMLLPLYQGKGNDGFFLCREVRPFWLGVSAWLRRLRLDALLPWLPGVRRHPELPDAYVVDPRIARAKPIEIFHLLGFRRQRREADGLVFTRRS
jgi:succinylglutamate desuccinylase